MQPVKPLFVQYVGEQPAEFVESKNLHRRHLTPGQRAAAVAALQDWAQAHAQGSNRHQTKTVEVQDCTSTSPSKASDRAHKAGVSTRTQKDADKVAKADPALAAKVVQGKVSLPEAVAKVSGKNKSKQAKAAKSKPKKAKGAAPAFWARSSERPRCNLAL